VLLLAAGLVLGVGLAVFGLQVGSPSGPPAVAVIRRTEPAPTVAADPAPAPSATAPGTVRGALAPAPDPRLVERSRFGPLPRIGSDGALPALVYARPAAAAAQPRIAILVTGLGTGEAVTLEAVSRLPPDITFAFAPYASDLDRLVGRARQDGHEVMLELPLEPFDYPDSDPGPHTITVAASAAENLERLHWVLGRFAGYTGLVTLMGAKVTADEAALALVLTEIASRGLTFVDDGRSGRSVVRSGRMGAAATRRADIVIDAIPRPDAMEAELARLEKLASEQGVALGTTSVTPGSIEALARWSRGLAERGVALVPVSALQEAGE
jgi:polysaccharide deacetylase 2 family uncharacterized protein YibQ